MTNAEKWLADFGCGQWRKARKEHRCDAFFFRRGECRGDGLIHEGDSYFDTQEQKRPFVPYRTCAACADAIAPSEKTD